MARGFNKVILMGNLARDPEIRYTVEKRAWARFTVAVGYSWKNRAGEFQEGADFIPVIAWGPLAERCGRYLRKGSGVLVEGRIRVRSYEARDGSGRKYATDVEASDVTFVGPKRSSDSDSFGSPAASQRGFADDADFGKSIREKGFGDEDEEFPTDFAEAFGKDDGDDEDSDIPF
ncbi:MAG: single-stranded DNA-binding protein [Fretibacterium sp.]|nr:single-stranded DNA-binding protein [Fretibacterium sp.]